MPQSIRAQSHARAVVFSPLDGAGRAQVVEQRLSDAIVLGLLGSGERLPSESELARQFNVAIVTAREALESLREKGLLETRRGRGGGSFVTERGEAESGLVESRLRTISRVELRDTAVHYSALAAMAAELAADRASEDDVLALERLVDSTDVETDGGARRAENTFRLEVAAVSQSARLVREHLRLQAEFGPLLWLNLRSADNRLRSRELHRDIVIAIAGGDGETARRITVAHLAEAVEWLIEVKSEIESGESS